MVVVDKVVGWILLSNYRILLITFLTIFKTLRKLQLQIRIKDQEHKVHKIDMEDKMPFQIEKEERQIQRINK